MPAKSTALDFAFALHSDIGVLVVVYFQPDVRKPGVGKFVRAGGQGRFGRQLNGVRRGAGNGGYCRVAGVFTGLGLFGGGVLLSVPPRAKIQTAFFPGNKRVKIPSPASKRNTAATLRNLILLIRLSTIFSNKSIFFR